MPQNIFKGFLNLSVITLTISVSRNTKISLSIFSCFITKCPQTYNLVKQKDYINQNRSKSLEIKCRIARIEVDYSLLNLTFLTASQKKSKLTMSWNFDLSSRHFVFSVNISLLWSSLLAIFPSYNTIFQLGQCVFKDIIWEDLFIYLFIYLGRMKLD